MFLGSDDLLSSLSSLFADESIGLFFNLVVTDGILRCSTNLSSSMFGNGGEYFVLSQILCWITLSVVCKLISLMA